MLQAGLQVHVPGDGSEIWESYHPRLSPCRGSGGWAVPPPAANPEAGASCCCPEPHFPRELQRAPPELPGKLAKAGRPWPGLGAPVAAALPAAFPSWHQPPGEVGHAWRPPGAWAARAGSGHFPRHDSAAPEVEDGEGDGGRPPARCQLTCPARFRVGTPALPGAESRPSQHPGFTRTGLCWGN